MKLSEELQWRGFVNQTTFLDINDVNQPRTLYIGVDPSADSMTIGNLASMIMTKHFINHGHKVILLVGGATGMIGDPDGKKQERDLRNKQTVEKNVEALKIQFDNLFDGGDYEIVNNADWFQNINYIDFLHSVGKNVSMTQLLDRDFVQQRIGEGGSGISYGEFSYSLIQGYDFLHLFREKGVTLQLAGADQWGNGITGVSLIRKLAGGEAHIFTAPLIINKQTGVKFGKSEGGAVWLDENKTSAYKFYQFWVNLDDETAESLIGIYTFMKKDEVMEYIYRHRENPAERLLQKKLAFEVTKLVHGETKAKSVEKASEILFSKQKFEFSQEVADILKADLPSFQRGQSAMEILVQAGLAKSNGEARRLINSGAVSLNGQKIAEDQTVDQLTLLKKGKNNFVVVD